MVSGSTASVRERLEDFVTTFENPEISAMAQICRILECLPDAVSRLRVMGWCFGTFSNEFKRPVTEPAAAASMTNLPAASAAAPAAAPAASPASAVVPTPGPVLVMPRAIENRPVDQTVDDFIRQVAELKDFFGER
jgi:hypothetical protein